MVRIPNTWKPISIEEYYADDKETLLMWNVLDIEEEKRVPWYSDEPVARSKKTDITGINRSTFNPRNNLLHLHKVAMAIGIKMLPIDIDEAFKYVIKVIKNDDRSATETI